MRLKIDMLVSILILTYNRFEISTKYIPELVSNLGDVECEVLIWDNFSNDGTFDWLQDYKKCDDRISNVFGSDKNIGMEAINYLAEAAKGDYIIKVDDDVEVPYNFPEKLITAYEVTNEPKLCMLSWDMPWRNNTFALRSGRGMYRKPRGSRAHVPGGTVYYTYHPDTWMVNGVCRLSPRKMFLEMGGHPKGIIYGVDYQVSKRAARKGLYTGFFHSHELVIHVGFSDTPKYRAMKNKCLKSAGAPLHV